MAEQARAPQKRRELGRGHVNPIGVDLYQFRAPKSQNEAGLFPISLNTYHQAS